MSVKARFQSIPVRVFDSFGDVVHQITYRSRQPDAYVPGGVVTPSYVDHATRAIQDQFTRREAQQGTVKLGDVRFLIAVTELPVEPKEDDKIVVGGDTYNVIGPIRKDPADALYDIQARR